jgi:transposase InsO family protein
MMARAHRIGAVHTTDNTDGAPRITAELNDGASAGERVNHKRVARVMRVVGIAGYRRKRRVKTTVADPANQRVADLLGRDFTAAAPTATYVGDITYLPLATGANLYLATVIDCCSRRVAGWAIADHMGTELVADALKAADSLRGGLTGSVVHTDHESVHLKGFRGPVPRFGGHPVDGGGGNERRQCARRIVQRRPQTRSPPGRQLLARCGHLPA